MKTYKSVLITAVVYSVVIGLIYVMLSVGAILARQCILTMDANPFIHMVYLLYFRVDKCLIHIDWTNLGLTSDVLAILPPESDAVNRTYIFSVMYLALYSALIFSASYSLCGINNSCLGRKSFPIFFAPWLIVSMSILVMDILATAYYIMDSINLTNNDGLMDLLEISNREEVGGVLENLAAHYRFLPPIFMFLITSKGFVFIVMDIVIIVLVTKAGWTASTYHKHLEETVRHYSSNMSRANPTFEDAQTDQIAQKQHTKQLEFMSTQIRDDLQPATPDRYNDTSIQAFVFPSQVTRATRQEQQQSKLSVQRPNSLAVHSQNNNDRTQLQPIDRDIDNRLSHFTASNGSVIRSTEPLKDEKASQQPVRIKVLPSVVEINRNSEANRSSSESKSKPIPPPKPQNSNRMSLQPWTVTNDQSRNSGGAKVDRTSSMNAPEELRGQLPWSYFKARDDVPKKSFTELKDDEDLPSVPVPDYTLHFPRGKRANIGSDCDGDGSLGRHDQRY